MLAEEKVVYCTASQVIESVTFKLKRTLQNLAGCWSL